MDGLLESLPSCALRCLLETSSISTCSLTDISCICGDVQLNAELRSCILPNCTIKEALTAQKLSYTTCQYPTNPDTHVYPIVNIAGLVVAIIAVVLRVAGRLIGSRIGFDDYTIIGSLAGAIAIAVIGIALGSSGLGRDIWMLSFSQITNTMHLFFVEEVLYIACLATTKTSMLLLYLRLFPDERFRLATKFILAFTICWGIAVMFAQIFGCQPLNYFWHMWDGEHVGKCIDHVALVWAHAIINIVLDLAIIGLPMPTLIRLNLSLGKKIGICFMFAIGIVVTVISILRFITSLSFTTTQNPTRNFVPVGVWSLLEVDLGILCACMPGIRAFFNYSWALFTDRLSLYASSSSISPSRSNHGSHHIQSKSTKPSSDEREFIPLQEVDSFRRSER